MIVFEQIDLDSLLETLSFRKESSSLVKHKLGNLLQPAERLESLFVKEPHNNPVKPLDPRTNGQSLYSRRSDILVALRKDACKIGAAPGLHRPPRRWSLESS